MHQVHFDVLGQVAVVTGGGSGIGRAIALGLSGIGFETAVIDMDPGRATRFETELAEAGRRGLGLVADVSRAEEALEAVARVNSELGRVDVLVNCAGIFPRSSVADMAEEEWNRTIATNLNSVFHISKAVLKPMIASKQGCIVTITSGLGTTGAPRGAHYAASKGGINAFTRSLAREVGDFGINVNAVAPGLTDTPMMRGSNSPEYIAQVSRGMPTGRLGEPEDCVGLVLFLVSEGARHITGQVIALRG